MLIAREMRMTWGAIRERLLLLQPVDMRTEIITDNPEVTIINDSYNSDPDSIRNAFALLHSTPVQAGKLLVLGDVPHLGELQESVQRQLMEEALALFGENNIITIGEVFGRFRKKNHYPSTDALLQAFDYEQFQNKTILLKASRSDRLERLIPLLNRHPNATYIEIDLDALQRNYQALRSRLPVQVKVMAMVKAFSYGSGSWEIASALAAAGVEYLSVAYASEGIHLRDRGIQLPIMVNNPDRSSLASLAQYELEPLIFDMAGLHAWLRAARMSELRQYRFHLKFDTGMGRLGFSKNDLHELIPFLLTHPDLEARSIMSHLAASDIQEEDDFTHKQASMFREICTLFTQETGLQPLRHILNTAGAIRFPEYAFDMVRLGLGLYGVNPAGEGPKLEEIASLRSHISQIHSYPAGTSISYGRAQYTTRPSRIATVPLGYVDGIFRMLGQGKTHMLVHGSAVPTFGRVCMDMLMLDVTDIPAARAGDEVVVFGKQADSFRSVEELARDAATIPYEVLARLSPRVRRVYVRGQ
jgi:alanine racemase